MPTFFLLCENVILKKSQSTYLIVDIVALNLVELVFPFSVIIRIIFIHRVGKINYLYSDF